MNRKRNRDIDDCVQCNKRGDKRRRGKGRKMKCPCGEKHETIKMGKKQRGKEGMSCNRDRRGRRDRERRGGNRGQRRMRCGTMIDRFLAGSICQMLLLGGKWNRGAAVRVRGRGQGSRGGSVKPGGSNASGQ